MAFRLELKMTLPSDGTAGTLLGRVFRPGLGPSVVRIDGDEVVDVTATFATSSGVCAQANPAAALRAARGDVVGRLTDILANTEPDTRDDARPWLLAPIDLQAIKACGVTFVISLLERVIEEQARGDRARAEALRGEITAVIGSELAGLVPGSEQAARVKDILVQRKLWSQYLEVGIGPDAEVFTKAPPMAAVGTGVDVGLHPVSTWNNPEPEIVLVVAPDGRIVGATLGNDVNLRDVEGRSALLLGKAKDNNGSAAVGPFIRLFDATFSLDDVRAAEVELLVEGPDGFKLEGRSSMRKIARDPTALVAQAHGPHHQYPDGFVLYCGTMFAPVEDRGALGKGFTHVLGDIVTVRTPALGALVNRVGLSTRIAPWTYGTGALMRDLARRGVL